MSDDQSPSDVDEFLKSKGWKFDIVQGDANKKVYVVRQYSIPNGKYSGTVVDLGLPIPSDYPVTAPYGVHVRAKMPFENNRAANPSPLGEGWQFWSRQVNDWSQGKRNAQYYMDHVDRWLEVN